MQKTTKFNSTKKARFTLPLKVLGILMAACAAISCSSFFETDVSMNSNGNNSSLYDLLTPPEKIEKLDAPSEIFISQGEYSGKIEISWNAVPNATSYKIERAVVTEKKADGTWDMPDDSKFELLSSSNIYNTKYIDTIIQTPKYTSVELNYVYYYRVFAQNLPKGYTESEYFPDYREHKVPVVDKDGNPVLDEKGNETITKKVYADPSKYGTLLKPVTEIEASKGTISKQIEIKWNSVPGAFKYEIQRCEREQGNYYTINQKTIYENQTDFIDEVNDADEGTEFYYKVYVINRIGQKSCSSAAALGYSLQPGAPTIPENIHGENGFGTSNSQLVIKWAAIPDPADISDYDYTYNLYRTSSNDSVYKLIMSKIPYNTDYFIDTSVQPGVYYYYFIQTIKTNKKTDEKLKSSFSETGKDSANPTYGFILSPPSYIEVTDGSDDAHKKIIWSPAVNTMNPDDAISFTYNIYADTSKNGRFETMVVSETEGTPDYNGNLYTEVPLDKGNFFIIKTVNPNGVDKESPSSEIVAPVPDAPKNVYATKTASADTMSKSISAKGGTFNTTVFTPNKNEVFPVLITWDNVDAADGGYDIYRSTKADSGFKKIDTTTNSQTYYIDVNDSAKSGIMYFYKVVSLNSLGQGRKSNDPANDSEHKARGFGAITREQWFREYNKNIASSQKKLTLMHKPSDLDKVGSETVKGNISGTLGYNAKVAGLGAEITMPYTNYADHFISDDSALGIRFILNGNTDTTSNMSANGYMHETVHCFSKEIDVTNAAQVAETFENLSEPAKNAIIKTGDTHYLCGMYPGYAIYNNLEIKGGAAGGGYYLVKTFELDRTNKDNGTAVLEEAKVNWLVGEEK